MYSIWYNSQGDTYAGVYATQAFHDPIGAEAIEGDAVPIATDAVLTQSAEAIDTLEFSIGSYHPLWEQVVDHYNNPNGRMWVCIKDSRDSTFTMEIPFVGYVAGIEKSMGSDGTMTARLTCESVEGILKDIIIDTTTLLLPGASTIDGETVVPMPDGTMRVEPEWYFTKVMELVVPILKRRYGMATVTSGYMTRPNNYTAKSRGWYTRNKYYYVAPTYAVSAYDALTDLLTAESAYASETRHDALPWQQSTKYLSLKVLPTTGMNQVMANLGIYVVDYSDDTYNKVATTRNKITLGDNLEDIDYSVDTSDIVTCLVPFGYEDKWPMSYSVIVDRTTGATARGTYEIPRRKNLYDYITYGASSSEFEQLQNLLTRNGCSWDASAFDSSRNWIKYTAGTKKYGEIWRTLVLDDAYTETTDDYGETVKTILPHNRVYLLWSCLTYLIAHSKPKISLTATVIDTTYEKPIGDISHQYYGYYPMDWVQVEHPLLGINTSYPVVERKIKLDEPYRYTLTMGTKTPQFLDQATNEMRLAERTYLDNGLVIPNASGNIGHDVPRLPTK